MEKENMLKKLFVPFDIDNEGNVVERFTVVEDYVSGKRYVYTDNTAIFTEDGICYEAMECFYDYDGIDTELEIVEPLNFVYVMPIFNNGWYLCHVYTELK